MQDLTKELLENKIAVQQNTKAVDDAANAGTAPASYTSSMWQDFRSALLTGTGDVMPQYTPPPSRATARSAPRAGTATTNTLATRTTPTSKSTRLVNPSTFKYWQAKVVFAQATAQ